MMAVSNEVLMIIEIPKNAPCQFPGCSEAATVIACGKDCGDGKGHPKVQVYCAFHSAVVVDELHPQYVGICPNCECIFGVN